MIWGNFKEILLNKCSIWSWGWFQLGPLIGLEGFEEAAVAAAWEGEAVAVVDEGVADDWGAAWSSSFTRMEWKDEHPVLIILKWYGCALRHTAHFACAERIPCTTKCLLTGSFSNDLILYLHQPRIQHCPSYALLWYGRCLTWHQPLPNSENPPTNHWHSRAQNSAVFNLFI